MTPEPETRILRIALPLALLAAVLPAAALGQVVDQSQTATNNGGYQIQTGQSVGQTFTAAISGNLTQLNVNLSEIGTANPVLFGITTLSGGLPAGAVLASATVTPSGGTIRQVNFGSPVWVTAGTQYAFTAVLGPGSDSGIYSSPTEGAGPLFSNGLGNPYTGGSALFYYSGTWHNLDALFGGPNYQDFYFQELVTPGSAAPEPSTWLLLAGGVALMFVGRRLMPGGPAK